jgi:Na+/H+ antiporter NhaC
MSFDIGRLRRSDRIIGASAIAFFIFLFFFKWYGASSSSSVGGFNYSVSANGWHTFTNSRWIWIIAIIVSLAAVAISAGVLELNTTVQRGVLVAGLGALSSILIVYRILDHPSAGTSGTVASVHYSASVGIKIGIWLGLIAALALTYGGYLGMQDEGTSLADVREQASGAFGGVSAAVSGSSSTGASATTADTSTVPVPPPAAAPAPEPPEGTPA